MVANEGHKLLPLYQFCPMSGQWIHQDKLSNRVMSLRDVRYRNGRINYPSRKMTAPEWVLPDYLKEAQEVFGQLDEEDVDETNVIQLTETFEHLRWFILPFEYKNKS